ncbi:hypothetical protein BDB01DRAFT_808484 [Pilobolus umbonatus]|nr:hypothetical protein BDB01DRAFT_808484 [Pilobolus umbonatus]
MYWLDRLKNWWKADHGLTEYEIQDKLGEGAFSDVYKAKHKLSGDEVAIKVIRKYELNKQQVNIRTSVHSPWLNKEK